MNRSDTKDHSNRNFHWYFLLLLISTDILFVLLHMIARYGPEVIPPDVAHRLQIDIELGYPEFFQYIKTFWIILFWGALWYKSRQSIYLIWGGFFWYVLIDDIVQIHESTGKIIGEYLTTFSYWAYDMGEMLFLLFVGALTFILIAAFYRFSDASTKMATRNIGLFLSMLIFFGFFGDIIHAALKFVHGNSLLAVVEDGGEMLVMSIICWYGLNLFQHQNHQNMLDSLNYVERIIEYISKKGENHEVSRKIIKRKGL